ncbi:MAG: alpha-ketoacid dehydrogenase subunit beta [Acidobacteriota bacterium]|nr:MAG: alpha-ketoacid dehydrogenase subunit beta [Acidobacteriota bacterium]
MAQLNMVQALNLALRREMSRDQRVVVLGQDVGINGGVFRVTEGLLDTFGENRVFDTPLAESAIVGSSVGMAINGLKPVCELQFSGFSYQGFYQLEQHAARMRNRTRGRFTCPIVVRIPYGGGIRALEHHSESREAYFAHTPGLKMVIPSGPRKARALLSSAVRDPDPVIFFEPKALYRSIREEIDENEEETFPLGKAELIREGDQITLIAYGAMLPPTLRAAETLEHEDGVGAEVVDLLTISPLDEETVARSVEKTGRAVIVHEAPRNCGVGAEIAARLVERVFLSLEAPIRRVTGYDIPVPYFSRENLYLPSKERILQAARETLRF